MKMLGNICYHPVVINENETIVVKLHYMEINL